MSAYVLLASELYSLPVLQPVSLAAQAAGHRVAWLCEDAMAERLPAGELRLRSRGALRDFAADAVFSTVHRIPPQLPGKQVQLFHGLNTDKRADGRGHFRIRGLFDLYCTHGPATTPRFEALAAEHGDFAVAETGWPKLDPLFNAAGAVEQLSARLRSAAGGRAVVMYASTFTESLSSARAILPAMRDLVARGDRYWLLTLHPKCAPDLFVEYRALACANAQFLEADQLLGMLRAADALVCDTSSVIEEFALLEKPIVTLRTRRPRAFMLDVATPTEVDGAIDLALAHPPELMAAVRDYAQSIHPWRDGASAGRVVAATERLLAGGFAPLRPRPRLPWRQLQSMLLMRRLLPG